MKLQITIVTGLPASGKTHYLKDTEGTIIDDGDFFCLPKQEQIKNNKLYISHPLLCLKKNQDNLVDKIKQKYSDFHINYMCFENNPKQCFENNKHRDGKRVVGLIVYLTKNYHIPENARIISVYNPKNKNRIKNTN